MGTKKSAPAPTSLAAARGSAASAWNTTAKTKNCQAASSHPQQKKPTTALFPFLYALCKVNLDSGVKTQPVI